MLIYSDIKETLQRLDKKFNNVQSRSIRVSNLELCFYAKIALLEYCGWIEQSFDVILQEYINKQTSAARYQDLAYKKIIKPVYGFNFEQDFCPLFLSVLGVRNYEILITKLQSAGEFELLKSQLDTLVTFRNTLAHTCFHKGANLSSFVMSGHSSTLPAPSAIYHDFFLSLLPIIKRITRMIARMKT